MVLADNTNALNLVLGRIQSIDQRIESLTSKTEKTKTELIPSFSQVFSNVRKSLSPRANRWVVEDALQKASSATGLDLNLLKAVMQQESGGNSNAVSSAGAKGLMQLIDSTAAQVGVEDPFDPHQNALGGAIYLKKQLERFGNIKLALAAYNAGPEAVAKYKGIPPYNETINYVNSIEAIYRGLKNSRVAKNTA